MNKRRILKSFVVEREETPIVLDISGVVHFGHPGKLTGPPENCFPPEPDDVTINYIHLNGKQWDGELTDSEVEKLEESLIAEAHDDEPEPISDDYDYDPEPYSDPWGYEDEFNDS